MLNPFIIDQIKRREKQRGFEQVQLELPKPDPQYYPSVEEKEEEPERGVVIIDVL